MKIQRVIFFSLCFTIPFAAFAWDPEDDTFDPTINSVIADGSTRIGDPSPFIREGYEKRGFTHVGTTIPAEGDPTVNVSLILMPDASDPAKQLGGALFLPVEKAKALSAALKEGATLSGDVPVWDVDWAGKWTLSYAENTGVVLLQELNGESARFILSVNAAKKLAGAIEHSISALADAG